MNEIPNLNLKTQKPPLIEKAKRDMASRQLQPYFCDKSKNHHSYSPTIESSKRKLWWLSPLI